MKHAITIYEKPTCSTCRQVVKSFEAHGVPFEKINYIIDPPTRETLTAMVARLDVPAKELIRTKEAEFKALGVDADTMTNAHIVTLLAEHPALMQRPVIEHDGKYSLGRPLEKIDKFLRDLK